MNQVQWVVAANDSCTTGAAISDLGAVCVGVAVGVAAVGGVVGGVVGGNTACCLFQCLLLKFQTTMKS